MAIDDLKEVLGKHEPLLDRDVLGQRRHQTVETSGVWTIDVFTQHRMNRQARGR